MFLILAILFASPNCPSTALWRTVAWQDCQSRAAAHARWCVCRKAPQVGQASAATCERPGLARSMPWCPTSRPVRMCSGWGV